MGSLRIASGLAIVLLVSGVAFANTEYRRVSENRRLPFSRLLRAGGFVGLTLMAGSVIAQEVTAIHGATGEQGFRITAPAGYVGKAQVYVGNEVNKGEGAPFPADKNVPLELFEPASIHFVDGSGKGPAVVVYGHGVDGAEIVQEDGADGKPLWVVRWKGTAVAHLTNPTTYKVDYTPQHNWSELAGNGAHIAELNAYVGAGPVGNNLDSDLAASSGRLISLRIWPGPDGGHPEARIDTSSQPFEAVISGTTAE